MIIYNDGKWDGIWDLPKYQKIREKILDEFKGLTFVEDGHRYFLEGKEMTCVSNVAHIFQEHFDSHQKAIETSERNFDNPDSKYYRMTPQQIEESWNAISNEACSTGSERHEFAESLFYYFTRQYDKILPDFKSRLKEDGGFEAIHPKEIAAAKFYISLPKYFIPILAETKVFDKDLGYSGTFDLLCYYDNEYDINNDHESGLVILDWKTNKDLYKNFKEKKLLYPFNTVLDMPLQIYHIQLAAYQNCLEKIGFKVVARKLMWLRPDGEYELIRLQNYTKRLVEYLKAHPIVND